ncbi:LOW QUALITY PROTEIN: TLC domain-containing protein 2 [Dryobates pubescens]|uniref:LOW QUALITY PROTEIN: TLC domain-containing protein 2 n=1 Tax=Dryobates pubescens TaxID=118200 RepID=UPI0023BA38D5|nr:LOW QUALITY PROTEIN: TLC domain-containing protein 2 [Dryobates pubescens]
MLVAPFPGAVHPSRGRAVAGRCRCPCPSPSPRRRQSGGRAGPGGRAGRCQCLGWCPCPGRCQCPAVAGRAPGQGEVEPSRSATDADGSPGEAAGRWMPMAFSPGLLVVAGSFAAFRLLNRELERLVPPPPSARRNRWKWRNIWTSLAHSVLSGGGALAGFCLHPELSEDLVGTHPPGAHSLVAVSVGYFLEDFVDMLCNQKLHQSWELLFHHSVVIVCFGIAVLLHQYVGFALVALLVEINSIFLHLRQILLMANLVHTTCYRLNSVINLGTYVVFRIATLAWMARWLLLNRQNVPPAAYAVGTLGMAIMMPMNIILLYRLLRSDFCKSSRDVQQEKEQ